MHAGKNKKRSNVYRILKRVKLDVSVKIRALCLTGNLLLEGGELDRRFRPVITDLILTSELRPLTR